MIGADKIIEARMRGKRPSSIFIEINQTRISGGWPTVSIEDKELQKPHDFRFVVGCNVHISAPTLSDDVLTIADKIVAAGAASVIVCCILDNDTLMHWSGNEWAVYA